MIGKYFCISLIDIIKKISAAKLNEKKLSYMELEFFFSYTENFYYSFTLKSHFLTMQY